MSKARPVKGIPGYWVDESGCVYSDKSGRMVPMRKKIGTRGYEIVALSLGRRGAYKHALVHRLVLGAWTDEDGRGLEVNHRNGVKTDNRLENLEWVTRLENERHSWRVLGKNTRGERHKLAKLTADIVRDMRRRRLEGDTLIAIAKRYGVGTSTVHRVVTGQKWAHVR